MEKISGHWKRVLAAGAVAASLSGCVLVPRCDAVAEDVFRNASGEAVAVPWDWAAPGGAGGSPATAAGGPPAPPGEGAP